MDMLAYFLGRLTGGGAGGSGPTYTDLVYNEDGTFTFIDEEGNRHTAECEYVDGRLEKIVLDGVTMDAVYEEGTNKLIKFGDMDIEVGDYPSEIDNLEDLIDNSGVLESTEGTATEKVEQLIDKAYNLEAFKCITNASQLFSNAKTFPSKAVVNLPNATNLNNAFSLWNSEPIPIVDELIVNAINVNENTANSTSLIFNGNYGVKKIVLSLPNSIVNLQSAFAQTINLEELVMNFSTKNNKTFSSTFHSSGVKRIIGVLDFSSATNVNYMFSSCNNLEEVTFAPNTLSISLSLQHSSELTEESIQSIIDGLATVETAQTLTLSSAITLTDEQKATINSKGWTLVQ